MEFNNKIYWVIIISFITFINGFTETQWQKQSTGIDNHIFDIDFVNLDQGWFVGSGGVIYVSIDGGEIWNPQESNVTNNLNAVCIVNENTGYIGGDNGIILKTINGGEEWQKLPFVTDAVIADILFKDELTGWAVSQSYPVSVLKTIDGGESWRADTLNTTFDLYDITMVNDNKLVVSGGFFDRLGYIAISNDAGESWNDIVPVTGEPLFSIHYTSNEIGYAMGGDFDFIGMSAWKTSDGGNVWTEMNSPLILRAITDMEFINPDTAWVCVTGGLLYRFTVNNENWELFESETLYSLYALDFVDENHGWVCGAFGFISRYQRNTVGISDDSSSLISEFELFQNYPNPFNPKTIIPYQLSVNSNVEISIYNSLGQKVEILVSQNQPKGTYTIEWEGGNLSSGIYYYQLKTETTTLTKKMLLVR